MEWLNYHHLLYFWTVAKEGSVARASDKLRLAQPTISGQIKALEESLGQELFTRAGRGLLLTDVGRVVFGYAEEIFGLGRELQDVLKGRPRGRAIRLAVGVSDLMPKFIAYRILQPLMEGPESVHLVCEEDQPERLFAELAEHRLDVVLANSPITSAVRGRAYNHLLGMCPVALFGSAELCARYQPDFPASLDGAPFLLPLRGSGLRASLDQWFDSLGVRPRVVAEFKDSALMKTFGEAGQGIFAAPSAIEAEVREHYRVALVGLVDSITERFYAVSMERKLKHPAVVALSQAARSGLFAPPASA